MMRRSTWMLALLIGCSFESAAAVETVDNRCGSDDDCNEGLCDGNICIDDSNASVEIAVEVLANDPDNQPTIPASWAFTSKEFSGSTVYDLQLPPIREVRGQVRWDGERVPAKLRFVRRMAGSVAPLQPVPIEVDTLREPEGGDGSEAYDFTTVLVAGETYDVTVLPTSDMVMSPIDASSPAIRSLPPLYLVAAIEGGERDATQRFDVTFPASLAEECADGDKNGCTLVAKVVSYDGEVDVPEAGLQVRAIDPLTGRVVSSIAETNTFGEFGIRVGEEPADYLIRVTTSATSEPRPAVSVDPEVVFEENPDEKVIRIPKTPAVQYSGRVRDENGASVPNATIRFLTTSVFDDTQLGLQGSFAESVNTNEDGSFGVALLPGFYTIAVTPPEDAETAWGVLTTEALVGEGTSGPEELVVPSRAELFGWVRTFQEEAAVGVTVSARANQSNALSSMHRSQEAVSNSLGGFTMRLDAGLYDMYVKVPSESGYPWSVEPALPIEGNAARTYRLVPPIPIEGDVLASDGVTVPGTLIRAYVLFEDETSSRPVQVGETTSDENGSYRLLIAPNLAGE